MLNYFDITSEHYKEDLLSPLVKAISYITSDWLYPAVPTHKPFNVLHWP